ncbi:single-stranded dna-binding protein [Limosilactobacillus oris DSM 4864]|uniref:Single-stranded DNA-binding protein n=1 Tax=Limosilactobacillus oris DSM 4864 TaxID=1423779 RepID=A0A0R1WAX4_9LACO|nr:single-stranded dna-binding protein [Limosilactobacillus oris DSM 4864]
MRYTTSGTAVVSFTLAVDRQFRNQNGDRDADFVNCVIWRKSAENFSNFTHKGSLVGVEGRIQTRNYENQQGNRVYVTEVVVDNFALLEPRQNGGMNQGGQQQPFNNGSNQPFAGQPQQQFGGNQPQTNNAPQGNPSSNNGFGGNAPANNDAPFSAGNTNNDGEQKIDVSDDELPF